MPNRLFIDEIVSVGAVADGDNPEAEIVFWKSKSDSDDTWTLDNGLVKIVPVEKRDVSTEERKRLASRGAAMSGGGFPIATIADLKNAIQAFGRAKNKTAAKRHIIKRARALGATKLLPEAWGFSKQVNRLTVPVRKGDRMAEFDFEGFTDDQRERVETMRAEYEETIAGLETPEVEEDVTKDAPPEVQELIAKQQAQIEAQAEDLAKERKIRRDAEFLAKAQELTDVLGAAEEWAPILDELEENAPDAYTKIVEKLAVAQAQLEQSDIFKELGSAGDGEQDRLTALAKAKMDDDPTLTIEAARVQVRRENPEIVEEERSL